jgi:hypothetical protein
VTNAVRLEQLLQFRVFHYALNPFCFPSTNFRLLVSGCLLSSRRPLQDIREQRDLYRLYLTFIQTITINSLASAFLAPQNSQCLTKVMTTLVEGARAHADMTVRKVRLTLVLLHDQSALVRK